MFKLSQIAIALLSSVAGLSLTSCEGPAPSDFASDELASFEENANDEFRAAAVIPNRCIIIFDYDGDGINDWGLFRPSSGTWHISLGKDGSQLAAIAFGQAGDIPVPADYNNDKKTDLAVWRPSDGTWYVRNTATGLSFSKPWGTAGDIPVPGDWTGDGQADWAVWRPSTGAWWLLSIVPGGVPSGLPFGEPFDTPVPSDYDGDGKLDRAIWRPSTGMWMIRQSSDNVLVTKGPFGHPLNIPVVGDYDGDLKADLAVYDYASGLFTVKNSSNGVQYSKKLPVTSDPSDPLFGTFDIPVPTWYGPSASRTASSLALFRPETGLWTMAPEPVTTKSFGAKGDIPVTRTVGQRQIQGSPLSATQTTVETLAQYAKKCNEAIGVAVPAFNCDSPGAATLLGQTEDAQGKCNFPARLSGACDPGSKMWRLYNGDANHPVDIVASCRKQGQGTGYYGDMAVIQTNRANGVSCFYQAFRDSGNLPAPSAANSLPWITPIATAGYNCVQCHDNGAIIRSPYFTHLGKDLPGTNTLPGSQINSYNSDQPYQFVGRHFANWKTWSVKQWTLGAGGSTTPNTCNGCHRMSISTNSSDEWLNIGSGSSFDFGIRATGPDGTESKKKPHSTDSPIWMTPGATFYNAANEQAAQAIKTCAEGYSTGMFPANSLCDFEQVAYSNEPQPAATQAFARPSAPVINSAHTHATARQEIERVISTFRRNLHRDPGDAEFAAFLARVQAGATPDQLKAELPRR